MRSSGVYRAIYIQGLLKADTPPHREQVDRILGKIHKAGFHHHDMAERNVLQDDKGKVTLIDLESLVPKEWCDGERCEIESGWLDE